MNQRQIVRKVLDVGGNDGKRSRRTFPGADVTVLDLKNGFDVTKSPLPKGDWDVIFVNHLIEHLIDPDDLLDKCREVMNEKTVLEISTPNLVAWFNRILFLAGYLPHSYEVSDRHNVGKAFDWNKEGIGGHVKGFNPFCLIQLLKKHGFRILSVKGDHSTYNCNNFIRLLDKLLTINPNLASSFRIKCTK